MPKMAPHMAIGRGLNFSLCGPPIRLLECPYNIAVGFFWSEQSKAETKAEV